MARSQAWKALERLVAKELQGERISRGDDFSRKDVDVRVPDFEGLQVDAKYRKRWAHHKFLAEVKEKYCRGAGDMPVLVTRTHGQRGAIVALSLQHFGAMLDVIRGLRKENERLRKRKRKG